MTRSDFDNCVLIAMPHLLDANFRRSVTYIFSHNDSGSAGVIINRPLNLPFNFMLEDLNIEPNKHRHASIKVCEGGPVDPESGFLLHEDTVKASEKNSVDKPVIFLDSSRRYLKQFTSSWPDKKALYAIGHASWGPGQLEREIQQGIWLWTNPCRALLFEIPFKTRWAFALKKLGIEAVKLSPCVGHT